MESGFNEIEEVEKKEEKEFKSKSDAIEKIVKVYIAGSSFNPVQEYDNNLIKKLSEEFKQVEVYSYNLEIPGFRKGLIELYNENQKINRRTFY